MMNLFRKLDRMAERLISTVDSELQEPVVRAVTGEVFIHGAQTHRPAAAPQVKGSDLQRAAHELCDAVAETLNPPLTIPVMPKAGISTQVT